MARIHDRQVDDYIISGQFAGGKLYLIKANGTVVTVEEGQTAPDNSFQTSQLNASQAGGSVVSGTYSNGVLILLNEDGERIVVSGQTPTVPLPGMMGQSVHSEQNCDSIVGGSIDGDTITLFKLCGDTVIITGYSPSDDFPAEPDFEITTTTTTAPILYTTTYTFDAQGSGYEIRSGNASSSSSEVITEIVYGPHTEDSSISVDFFWIVSTTGEPFTSLYNSTGGNQANVYSFDGLTIQRMLGSNGEIRCQIGPETTQPSSDVEKTIIIESDGGIVLNEEVCNSPLTISSEVNETSFTQSTAGVGVTEIKFFGVMYFVEDISGLVIGQRLHLSKDLRDNPAFLTKNGVKVTHIDITSINVESRRVEFLSDDFTFTGENTDGSINDVSGGGLLCDTEYIISGVEEPTTTTSTTVPPTTTTTTTIDTTPYDKYDPMAGPAQSMSHSMLTAMRVGTGAYRVNTGSDMTTPILSESQVSILYKYDSEPATVAFPEDYYHQKISFSETTSGTPKVGEYIYIQNYPTPPNTTSEWSGRNLANEGYIPMYSGATPSSTDANFVEGDICKFKNVLKIAIDPNGYAYISEILEELPYDLVVPTNDLQPFTVAPKVTTFSYDFQRFIGNQFSASWDDSSVNLSGSIGSLLGTMRENAKVLHLSFDGGATWYDYVIKNFTGNVITIEGVFGDYITTSTLAKVTFAPVNGKITIPQTNWTFHQWGHGFRAGGVNGTDKTFYKDIGTAISAKWNMTGDDSFAQGLVGNNFKISDDTNVDWGYDYELRELTDSSYTIYPSVVGVNVTDVLPEWTFFGPDWNGVRNAPSTPMSDKVEIGPATAYFVTTTYGSTGGSEWRINGSHSFSVGDQVIVKHASGDEFHIAFVSQIDSSSRYRLKSYHADIKATWLDLMIYQA